MDILDYLRKQATDNIKAGEGVDSRSYYAQTGVLLSNQQALDICSLFEQVMREKNAAAGVDAVPDYGTGFRPDWSQIDPKYNVMAVDKSGRIFLYTHMPSKQSAYWWADSADGIKTIIYPFTIKYPVENWQECLWIRPGHEKKEGEA